MRFLIGIDDTDNLESRGTGFIARSLGLGLEKAGIARLQRVVRHQLLVHPDIPYTSHNSSASLLVELEDREIAWDYCRGFMLENAAEGSDVGLCLAAWESISEAIIAWGNKAKREVIRQEDAVVLALHSGISLEGLTGQHTGIIGSLAAIGLHKAGNDGRVLWMPGLRELSGVVTCQTLVSENLIESIQDISGEFVPLNAKINVGEWARPVMQAGKPTLFIERNYDTADGYRVAGKDFIKRLSE